MAKDIIEKIQEIAQRDIHDSSWIAKGEEKLRNHIAANPLNAPSQTSGSSDPGPAMVSVTASKMALALMVVFAVGFTLVAQTTEVDSPWIPITTGRSTNMDSTQDVDDAGLIDDTDGESTAKPTVSTTLTSPSAQPTPTHEIMDSLGLKVTTNDETVRLDWTSFTGETFSSYIVIRATVPDNLIISGNGEVIAVFENQSRKSYIDNSVISGERYYYRIGVSPNSSTLPIIYSEVVNIVAD